MPANLHSSAALAAMLTITATPYAVANPAFQPDPAVFVVIENGGVVQDPEGASKVISFTLGTN